MNTKYKLSILLFLICTNAYADTNVTRALNVGSFVGKSTSGSLLYVDSSNKLAQDNTNLFWDATNQRFYINQSAHDIVSALTIIPKVATDALIFLKGASSQSGNYLTIQDSSANELANFNSIGTLNFTNPSLKLSLSDARSFSTGPAIRGLWVISPTYSFTGDPTGILPADSIFVGATDGRTINLTTNTADNIYGMEFNMVRQSTFLDNGVTSAIGTATRSFIAIKTSFQDNGDYTNTHTTHRNTTVSVNAWNMGAIGTYAYIQDANMLHEVSCMKFTVAMNPGNTGGGTLRRLETGGHITLTGTATGTSLGIGYYGKVTTYTDNYFLVNGSAANNYMGFNNSKSLFGGTAFVLPVAATNYSITGNYGSLYYDGTNFIINSREVGSTANLSILSDISFLDFNIILGTTTGTKIGTATSQKIGFWNTAPIIQPTTGVAAATFVANTSGIVDDSATFDGYTIGQVVKALRNMGALA